MTTVEGLGVRFTHLDKVLYPATGTTKSEVIDYYVAVAPFLLPGEAGRPLTRKRWPAGVEEPAFFAKDLEPGTPSWMPRVQIPHTGGPKFYPLVDSAAGLAWLGQVAALELHVPQWRLDPPAAPHAAQPGRRIIRYPDRVVFDLDPGPGAGLAQCAQVALAVRQRLGWLGEQIVPVTSGSKPGAPTSSSWPATSLNTSSTTQRGETSWPLFGVPYARAATSPSRYATRPWKAGVSGQPPNPAPSRAAPLNNLSTRPTIW